MNLYLSRNFSIGRDHLTGDKKTSLCGVPLVNEAYPP
jgi:hypothetical protein